MRCLSVRLVVGPVAICLLLRGIVHAAVLTGRVVGSTGEPVAGAEVRIWQRLPARDGPGVSDQLVRFDDGDALVTDGEGRFTSPDVLVGEAMAPFRRCH